MKPDLFKIFIILYIIASILITIPLFIFAGHPFFLKIINLLKFRMNFFCIITLLISVSAILIFDYAEKYKKQTLDNLSLYKNIFGDKPPFFPVLLIALLSGYFEELLFRGILYFLFNLLFGLLIKDFYAVQILSVILISLLFGLLHITQGYKALIFSFFISVIFFLTVIISGCVIYAMTAHAVFNFIEIKFIYPYQRLKFARQQNIEQV